MSNDYLWVFSLPDGTCLKKPGDRIGDAWLAAAKSEIRKKVPSATGESVYRNWLTASEWSAAGELQINVRIRYGRETGTCDFTAPAVFRAGSWGLQAGTVNITPPEP